MRRALSIDERSYGADHPDVATRLNNLAQVLYATNRLVEAEPLYRRAVEIFVRFGKATGHEHPHMRVDLENYRILLAKMKLPQEEIDQRVRAAMETAGALNPIDPEVGRLLGPAKSTKEVLEALDRQYREEGKPAIWFLPLNEPIVPHLDELLGPLPKNADE